MKTWFITGTNWGLGFAIARTALEAGDQVVATARSPSPIAKALSSHVDRLCAARVDVTDPSTLDAAVNTAIEAFGGIDILVKQRRLWLTGSIRGDRPGHDRTPVRDQCLWCLRRQPCHSSRHAPPARRPHSYDRVDRGHRRRAGAFIYCATKHAVSGWSEGLAPEVASFGIQVTCIYPGRFRTDFLDSSSVGHGEIEIDDYRQASTRHKAALDADNHRQIGDAVKFADVVMRLVASATLPIQFGAGSDAFAAFLRKAVALTSNSENWKALTLSTDFAR